MFLFVFIVIFEASRAAGTSMALNWSKRVMVPPLNSRRAGKMSETSGQTSAVENPPAQPRIVSQGNKPLVWVVRDTGRQKCEKIKNWLR